MRDALYDPQKKLEDLQMKRLFLILAFALFIASPAVASIYGKGEYTNGQAVSERDTLALCAGYISNALANSLKPLAQKDANSKCRSGRAKRITDWDVDCQNGYTIVEADFICR